MKRTVILLVLGTLIAATAIAQLPHTGNPYNYDLREVAVEKAHFAPTKAQLASIEKLRAENPNLNVELSPEFGVIRKLTTFAGYLTEVPLKMGNARQAALGFVRQNAELLGLTKEDLRNLRVRDEVHSSATGATHLVFVQTHKGLPVYNGLLQVNLNRDGHVMSVYNGFVPDVARFGSRAPVLGASAAVEAAAKHLGIPTDGRPEVLARQGGAENVTVLRSPVSNAEITASLGWVPFNKEDIRLAWNFTVDTPDGILYDLNIDALNSETITRFSFTADGSFRVYAEPDESPTHGTQSRTLVVDPEDATASPNGWFTGGTMSGNNVTACPDANGNNGCDSNPQCSGTTCDFALNLSQAPSNYIPAATANLFYWNNHIHDVQYQYGFDEAAGNFQEDNFGRGGSGSDSVNADAQDGSGNCNANFSTPTDGGNPRMQMFTCDRATPDRDGDFDNGVIVHEYGHGISIRQVGGPGTSSCLNNSQQAGEGWSDLFGLIYTAETGDAGTDARGIGSYLFNETPEGGTIRDLPYSTDSAVNNWTYESINGAGIPHGVGSRWAQVGWELYWALVAKHGFAGGDQLLDPVGGGWTGSHRALLYINEGLKNTACSPTFLDNRDGIIQAVNDNFGGADLCDVWQVFADYGMGANAVSGGSGSTSPTNGFDLPPECGGPAGPPTGNCAAGETEYVGRLSSGSAVHGEGSKSNPSGSLQCTVGSANLDLFLDSESCSFFSCSWSTAASSQSAGCNESINASGSGTFRWRVVHASGGQADYALCTND